VSNFSADAGVGFDVPVGTVNRRLDGEFPIVLKANTPEELAFL